jgi:hypothetical protein
MMPSGWIKDWATFLQIQFVTPINRLYDLGATVVVLTFDNYEFCPGAKNPTQKKRTTKIPKVAWDQRQELPSTIPEEYMTWIMWQPNPPQSFTHIAAAQFALFTRLSVFYHFRNQKIT